MHYMDTDKRLDEWVLESSVRLNGVKRPVAGSDVHTNGVASLKKRKRSATPLGQEEDDEDLAREVKMSEEEYAETIQARDEAQPHKATVEDELEEMLLQSLSPVELAYNRIIFAQAQSAASSK